MQIEKKDVSQLLPADYNPRKDLKPGDKEYEKLKRSLAAQYPLDRVAYTEGKKDFIQGIYEILEKNKGV